MTTVLTLSLESGCQCIWVKDAYMTLILMHVQSPDAIFATQQIHFVTAVKRYVLLFGLLFQLYVCMWHLVHVFLTSSFQCQNVTFYSLNLFDSGRCAVPTMLCSHGGRVW